MNPQNDNAETETNLSDYDKEWASDEEVTTPAASQDETAVEHSGEDSKTPEEDPASSDSASEPSQEETQDDDPSKAAEPEEEDLLAGLNDKQREAFQKLERDRKADAGRVRVASHKAQTLEQQLQALRDENANLKQANSTPTQFEQDHPEYAEDLKKIVGTDKTDTSTVTPEELVLAAHSDVGEITQTAEFSAWVAEQDDEMLTALNSPSAAPVILALNKYKKDLETLKTQQAAQAKEEKQEPPAGLADVGGSSSIPDKRPSSSLTSQEQYDREWAEDDI